MLSLMKSMYTNVTNPYPEQYREKIHTLKVYAENEIHKTIDEILTKPQRFVGSSERMLLSEAINKAMEEDRAFLEFEAPLLTFPRATPEKWNGDIDHVDTLAGTYTIFTGGEYDAGNLNLMKSYKGAPVFLKRFQTTLGPNYMVTISVDPLAFPAVKIIMTFCRSMMD